MPQMIKIKKDDLKSLKSFSVKNVRYDIDNWLGDYLEESINLAQTLDSSYAEFWKIIQQTILNGGKRLRPYLLLLCYNGFGGKNYIQAIQIAAAHELLHQCLLIHDDIIDRDYIRHGKDNLSGYIKKRFDSLGSDANHYAASEAILAGDLLLSSTYQVINDSAIDPTIKQLVTANVHQAMQQVAAGELLDIESALRPIEISKPIVIADLKTASYSFSLPLINGAILAGALSSEIKHLNTIGHDLGIAYQLQDDLLGLFGDDLVTGKPNITDISEGKHTLLIKMAYEKASALERQLINDKMGIGKADITVEAIEEIKKIVISTGAYNSTKTIIDLYTRNSLAALDKTGLTPTAKLQFSELIKQLLERSR